jgi:hypothetical protein
MTAPVDVLADKDRYDVVRPLADGNKYWLIGRAMSLGDASELAAFHRPNDWKYSGSVFVRPHRPRPIARVGGAK